MYKYIGITTKIIAGNFYYMHLYIDEEKTLYFHYNSKFKPFDVEDRFSPKLDTIVIGLEIEDVIRAGIENIDLWITDYLLTKKYFGSSPFMKNSFLDLCRKIVPNEKKYWGPYEIIENIL